LDRDSSSLKTGAAGGLPGVDKPKPPVRFAIEVRRGRKQRRIGQSDCACAFVTTTIIVAAIIIEGRMDNS
jgi:hypothetical protein